MQQADGTHKDHQTGGKSYRALSTVYQAELQFSLSPINVKLEDGTLEEQVCVCGTSGMSGLLSIYF